MWGVKILSLQSELRVRGAHATLPHARAKGISMKMSETNRTCEMWSKYVLHVRSHSPASTESSGLSAQRRNVRRLVHWWIKMRAGCASRARFFSSDERRRRERAGLVRVWDQRPEVYELRSALLLYMYRLTIIGEHDIMSIFSAYNNFFFPCVFAYLGSPRAHARPRPWPKLQRHCNVNITTF